MFQIDKAFEEFHRKIKLYFFRLLFDEAFFRVITHKVMNHFTARFFRRFFISAFRSQVEMEERRKQILWFFV